MDCWESFSNTVVHEGNLTEETYRGQYCWSPSYYSCLAVIKTHCFAVQLLLWTSMRFCLGKLLYGKALLLILWRNFYNCSLKCIRAEHIFNPFGGATSMLQGSNAIFHLSAKSWRTYLSSDPDIRRHLCWCRGLFLVHQSRMTLGTYQFLRLLHQRSAMAPVTDLKWELRGHVSFS